MPTPSASIRRRSWLPIGLAAAVALGSPPALAQGGDPTARPDPSADAALVVAERRAAELKQAADQAMDSFHYADALELYGRAYALAPRPALLYNQGRALQALNRHPEALAKLDAFKATAPDDILKKVPDLDKLLAELRGRVGTLGVSCNVVGARVLVDHTVVGRTPLAEPLRLNAGPLTLDVEAEGYLPVHRILDLKGAEALVVDARLVPNTNGILIVAGSSPGAEVTIDGVRIGAAPAEQMVPAGTHRLLLRHPQFADTLASVVVDAGERKEITVPLRSKPVTSRWWFWTSLGAVAATAGAVTAVGLSTRSADTGTIPPGRLTSHRPPFGARVGLRF